ncbi:MAG TPA: rod shape-determining protein MreD [Acidimicrobiales bacterium]|nr:rod shape-determining protein MreD [Acidimicrobiales bacterium]
MAAALRNLRLPVVIFVALLAHTTVLPDVGPQGVRPDVMLLLAIASGIVAGPERAAIIGFVAGMLGGMFVQAPLGLAALVYSIVGYAVGTLQAQVLRASWWIPIASAAVATAVGTVLYALVGAVVGQSHLVSPELVTIALVAAALNAVLAIAVVPAIAWAFGDPLGNRRRKAYVP